MQLMEWVPTDANGISNPILLVMLTIVERFDDCVGATRRLVIGALLWRSGIERQWPNI